MSEQQIQNQIIAMIRANGGWCQRINSGAISQTYTNKTGNTRQRYIKMADKGTPDIIACIKGIFVGVEVKGSLRAYKEWQKQKTDTHVAQHMQKTWILESGGIYLIGYDVQQIEDDLRELKLI